MSPKACEGFGEKGETEGEARCSADRQNPKPWVGLDFNSHFTTTT